MESNPRYPLISIGIPTHNGNIGIISSLTSIWEQGYPNCEIIISDNCSTDNTYEIIQQVSQDHPEIKCFRQETNLGMIPNFEFVLRKASGKYFMWLGDDDTLEPGILTKYVEFLEKNTEYSIVSGAIRYWLDNTPDIVESGFTFEQDSPGVRVSKYYFKVIFGGMIHGLMRRELTKEVSLRKVIGNDYHFMANLAYLGKIKNFDFIGYNKSFGGTSKAFKEYAKAMGESDFAANFPHLKMACDAFMEVMYRSQVFANMRALGRLTLAVTSFSGVFLCYYGRIFPYSVAGKVKRFIRKPG